MSETSSAGCIGDPDPTHELDDIRSAAAAALGAEDGR